MKGIEEKAIKLVLGGRVRVAWTDDEGVAGSGEVEGDHGRYVVSFNPEGRACSCPAGMNGVTCSHAIALELAVAKHKEDRGISHAARSR